MKYTLPLLCTLVGASSACLDQQRGSRAADDTADTQVASDTLEGSESVGDGASAPDGVATETAADVIGCAPNVTRSGFMLLMSPGGVASQVVLDGTVVFGTTQVDSAISGLRLLAEDVASSESQIVADDAVLLDARDGQMLVAYTESLFPEYPRLTRLELHTRGGSEPRVLVEALPSEAWINRGKFEQQSVRLVERDAAIWSESEGRTNRVMRYRDGRIVELASGMDVGTAPYLRGGYVLWTAWRDGASELVLAHPDDTTEVLTRTTASIVGVLTDDAAWWIEDGKVRRRALAGGEVETKHDGVCRFLVADGTQTLSICGDEQRAATVGYFATGRPVLFDGTRATVLETLGGEQFGGLALSGTTAAWVESQADGRCGDLGDLVVASVGESRRVAQVGAGCWCCNAYWPTAQVAMSAQAIAWNYATSGTGNGVVQPYDRYGDIGWALLEACTAP